MDDQQFDAYGQVVTPSSTKVVAKVPNSVTFNEYGIPSDQAAVPNKPGPDTGQSLKDVNWQDKFRNYVSPAIRQGMITGGTGVGVAAASGPSVFAGPGSPAVMAGGGVLGATAGDQIYQQVLQRLAPRLFGSAPDNVQDSLLESGKEGVASEIGGKVVEGGIKGLKALRGNNLKLKLLDSVFPSNPSNASAEIRTALDTPEGQALKPTVGQYTQNTAAQTAEDLLANQKKLTLINSQQGTLKGQAEKTMENISNGKYSGFRTAETSPASIAANAENKAKDLYFGAKESEKRLWKNLSTETDKMSDIVYVKKPSPTDPKVMIREPQEIKAPVHIDSTQGFAWNVSNALNEEINATTDPSAQSYLTRLKGLTDKLADPSTDISGRPTLGYADVKARKDELNRLINDRDMPADARASIKRQLGLLNAVAKNLNDDLHNSVNLEWIDEARNAFNRANTKTKQIASTFYGHTVGNDIIDPDKLQENVLDKALTSPVLARQYRNATGTRTEIGSAFARKGFDAAQDANGNFDGNKLLKYITDNGDVAKEVLTSDQRNALTQMSRRMQGVDPNLVVSGKTALAFKEGTAILALTGGLLHTGLSGSVTSGTITSGLILGAVKMSKDVAEKMLLNPKNAYALGQLSHLPAKSTQAQSLMRMILKNSLAGQILDTDQGPMKVQSDGSVKPSGQDISLIPGQR